MSGLTKAQRGWRECGWPRRVTYATRHTPPQPCGRPTVDGIACAKHAALFHKEPKP